jgi:hypothetical protein
MHICGDSNSITILYKDTISYSIVSIYILISEWSLAYIHICIMTLTYLSRIVVMAVESIYVQYSRTVFRLPEPSWYTRRFLLEEYLKFWSKMTIKHNKVNAN